MSSQTTKRTLQYFERTEFLSTSIRTQKPTVNVRLAGMTRAAFPEGDGPPEPDWDGLQEFNLALLEASALELRRTEGDHQRARLSLDQLRQERRALVVELKEGHRALRKSFAGTYGPEHQPLVGLGAAPARNYPAFREQVKVASERMRDPELVAQLPEPLAGQKPIDLDDLAEAQEGVVERLDATTQAITATRKRSDESFVAKQQAQKDHRRVYSNVARVQEGLYRLAGLDDLADRIRATEPAPRQKPGEEEKAEEAAAPAEQNETQEEQKALPADRQREDATPAA